jgi:hypothetical protein
VTAKDRSMRAFPIIATAALAACLPAGTVKVVPEAPFVVHIVDRILLPDVPERYTAITVARDDTLLIATAAGDHGRILSVSRNKHDITSRPTLGIAGSIAATPDGRLCTPTAAAVVRCTGNGHARDFQLPGADGINTLFLAGRSVVAFDQRHGWVFRLSESGAQRLVPGFRVFAAAADDRSIALVGAHQRCFFDSASGARGPCAQIDGLGEFGPADTAAVASRTTYVYHIPDKRLLVITPKGTVIPLALGLEFGNMLPRDPESIWIGGADAHGFVLVAQSGTTSERERVNAGLANAYIVGRPGGGLVVMGPRVALYVDIERRRGSSGPSAH